MFRDLITTLEKEKRSAKEEFLESFKKFLGDFLSDEYFESDNRFLHYEKQPDNLNHKICFMGKKEVYTERDYTQEAINDIIIKMNNRRDREVESINKIEYESTPVLEIKWATFGTIGSEGKKNTLNLNFYYEEKAILKVTEWFKKYNITRSLFRKRVTKEEREIEYCNNPGSYSLIRSFFNKKDTFVSLELEMSKELSDLIDEIVSIQRHESNINMYDSASDLINSLSKRFTG